RPVGVGLLILLGAAGLARLSLSQAGGLKGGEEARPKRKLFMLINVKVDANNPRVPQRHILSIFKDGLKAMSASSGEKDISIRPLSSQGYRALRDLTSTLATEADSGNDGRPTVRSLRVFELGEKDKGQSFTEWE